MTPYGGPDAMNVGNVNENELIEEEDDRRW